MDSSEIVKMRKDIPLGRGLRRSDLLHVRGTWLYNSKNEDV
jgi:hypothetical protein